MAAFFGVVLGLISIVCAIFAQGLYSTDKELHHNGFDSSAFLFSVGAVLAFAGATFLFIKWYRSTKGNRLTYATGEVISPGVLIFIVGVALIILLVVFLLLVRGFSGG